MTEGRRHDERETPRRADAFIGRREELAALRATFDQGDRIVTLVGPPGIGKTRLAQEYARAEYERHAGHSWFGQCDLSQATDERDFRTAIAETVGLGQSRARARATANRDVGRALSTRGDVLLVLDDVERVAAPVARAVVEWAAMAPDLRILSTSRERLRVSGEVCLEIGPLGLPDDTNASESEAVDLFLRRARAHDPAFRPTPDDRALVASLVRTLDGIPLAIELAAARLRILGIGDLTRRLAAGIDVLSRGERHAGARQATLRGAIQWSWDLLTCRERDFLARASVFRGGFRLATAEAVLNADGSAADVLDVLHSLRDKSMLRVRETDAGARFDVYFGVREVGAEQLGRSGHEVATRAQHAAVHVTLALEAQRDGERSGSSESIRRIAPERGNLLAAYEHLSSPAASATAAHVLDAILALEPLLLSQGPAEKLLELIESLLARTDAETLDADRRGRALRARAKALELCGSLDLAERDFDAALDCVAGNGNESLMASLLVDAGVLHHRRRHLQVARERYTRALQLYGERGSNRLRARVLGNLGAVHHDERDFDAAERDYRKALGLLRREHEPRLEGNLLANLGVLATEQGRYDEAEAHFSRAEAELRHAGDRRLLGIVRGNRGALAFERGDAERALRDLSTAISDLSDLGDLSSQALCLARRAAVDAELATGDDWQGYFAAAERLIDGDEDPLVLMAVRLFGALAELSAGEPTSDVVGRVRARMAEARAPRESGASLADLSDDVRAALRLLDRRIARIEPLGALLGETPADALLVGPDAAWFRIPGGISQSLAAHGPARRILFALVHEHAETTPRPLTLDDLREAGWPGERMSPEAATNRVHVALAQLRRQGLKLFIHRRTDGYALDAALRLHHVDLAFPEPARSGP